MHVVLISRNLPGEYVYNVTYCTHDVCDHYLIHIFTIYIVNTTYVTIYTIHIFTVYIIHTTYVTIYLIHIFTIYMIHLTLNLIHISTIYIIHITYVYKECHSTRTSGELTNTVAAGRIYLQCTTP